MKLLLHFVNRLLSSAISTTWKSAKKVIYSVFTILALIFLVYEMYQWHFFIADGACFLFPCCDVFSVVSNRIAEGVV